MAQAQLFYRFGAALIIGVLIGLEREHAKPDDEKSFAGVRTFALLALVGGLAGLIADQTGTVWVFIGIVLVVGALIGVAYFVAAWRGEIGLTTELAGIMTFLLGTLCYWGQLELAGALAVTTAVLLSLKGAMHNLAQRITREDVYATLKFAVITAIVLPILPRTPVAPPPFDILIPYNVWLMVVFISAISFLGYILLKLVGARQGIGLAGLLGGLVSSTAVTLSFSERSQRQSGFAKTFALAILVSWTMMFGRVLVEVAVLNRALLQRLWIPIAAAAAAGLFYSLYLYRSQHAAEKSDVSISNPFELASAVKFGLFYAVVLVISRAAQQYLGNTGLYLSSILAGLADVDAITLSMAEMSAGSGDLTLVTAKRAIVLAAMSNTAVKGGIVLLSGSPSLRKAILPGFALMIIVGSAIAFLF